MGVKLYYLSNECQNILSVKWK